ncbi:MAG: hypothetical protein K8R18_11610 [Parvibaculum sp.]|uniref:hypothetical protein n=1 Tax=Parvibaculum sp. TaxID=2024848 RepID=UPI0025CC993B|nr:hypothetical protein [Parvibaculum sp.]MCE9650257.1 hypothetical protein [Parvibaculum sp.]
MDKTTDQLSTAASRMEATLRNSSTRAFYVGSDRTKSGKPVITVHGARSVVSRAEMNALRGELLQTGEAAHVKLRRYSDRGLQRAGSIEAFVKAFKHERSLLDQTGAVDRGLALVDFARRMRGELGEKLAGIYWNSRWRTAYVVLAHKHFIRDGMLREAELGDMESLTLRTLHAATAGLADDFKPAIRLSFEIPAVPLVAIDARSMRSSRSIFSMLRSNMMMPALGAMIGLGSAGMAAADEPAPAVSGINGKIAIIGGYSDADGQDEQHSGLLAGSLTIPGDTQFGVQVDGAIGRDGGSDVAGIGGHFFWRDPSKALLGLTLAHVEKKNDNAQDQALTRTGAEGEIYFDQFTISARGGYQFGSQVDDGIYSGVDLAWYATDNLRLVIGGANDPQLDTTGHVGAEFQPGIAALPGLSVFADAAVGDDSYVNASIGLRYYFGASEKSLKLRHRLDDPVDNLALQGLTNFTPKKTDYTAPYIPPS